MRHARCSVILASILWAWPFLACPVIAQVDLSGTWSQPPAPDNTTDPFIGDYTGLPINDAARLRADSWTAEKWTQEEHECEPHPADYAFRAPGGMRIWPETNPLTQEIVAWRVTMYWMNAQRTIYMDGREPPPPYAASTWEGFSTGKWEGDKLEVTTIHLKEGWLRRNGVPRSEKASLVEYFIRHGDFLTIVSIVKDPVYLTEPLVRTEHWVLNPGYSLTPSLCIPRHEIDHPKGWVSHHLPGTNPWLGEFPSMYGIPVEAARGGAETIYPEFLLKLQTLPIPPAPEKKAEPTK
ncbi:MAG TPA: hypothetical protein VEJ45_05235 [Candidatus Acidoferrales bacterium]|nr:hypothetical protein [Candidatus Acidoferrales bacterium]